MQRSRSPAVIGVVVVLVALVGLLAYGMVASKPDRGIDHALAKGNRTAAPGFTLGHLDGSGRASLADYRGKVVVLNFWASWCEPCRVESPLLDRWQKRISAQGRGTVLGVDVLDVTDDARAFARKEGLSYPLLRDREGDSLKAYGVVGNPETFVIDRSGRIAASQRGPVDDRFMRDKVLPLLREGA